ncbi:MAG TPA: PKD domain-containing protein [Gaiellaceae bacterium]|nr:PKD domain-containing protein [Gaiellaceae bacterium]
MITVTVTDDDGGSGQDDVSVSNAAPIVDAGPPASGAEGSAIALSGSVTDTDGPSPTTIMWTYAAGAGVDVGATCSFADASSPSTTITCTDDGTYTATLTASDGLNPPASDSTTVTVTNATPSVTIDSPAAGATYLPGATVSVSASFTDAGTNDTHTCTIDWGDGSPVTAGTVSESNGSGTCTGSHSYTAAGSGPRTITVRVTDDDGATGQATVGINVSSARSLKQDAAARANALIPGASKPDADKLKMIVSEINKSLDPTLWGADGNHLNETKGGAVFDHEKKAAKALMDLLNGTSIPDSSLQPIVDDLMNADALLAQTEIADAVAAGGNAMKISEANAELAKAATERSKGHYDPAVDHYKHAWEHARDAF